jgi:hypothetical protein
MACLLIWLLRVTAEGEAAVELGLYGDDVDNTSWITLGGDLFLRTVDSRSC